MVTGDNALTALSVAKACGAHVFAQPGLPSLLIDAPHQPQQEEGPGLLLQVLDVERGVVVEPEALRAEGGGRIAWERFNVVVTGAAFSLVAEHEKEGGAGLWVRQRELLRYAGVFARFNPKEKQQVIPPPRLACPARTTTSREECQEGRAVIIHACMLVSACPPSLMVLHTGGARLPEPGPIGGHGG